MTKQIDELMELAENYAEAAHQRMTVGEIELRHETLQSALEAALKSGEPVYYESRTRIRTNHHCENNGWGFWEPCSKEAAADYEKAQDPQWEYEVRRLYAAPPAQPDVKPVEPLLQWRPYAWVVPHTSLFSIGAERPFDNAVWQPVFTAPPAQTPVEPEVPKGVLAAIRNAGLALAQTASGYRIMNLGEVKAQAAPPAQPDAKPGEPDKVAALQAIVDSNTLFDARERQHRHSMDQFKEVCKGSNCRASKAMPHHSDECKAEHDKATVYTVTPPAQTPNNPDSEMLIGILAAIANAGLTLVKTQRGYTLERLGKIEAQGTAQTPPTYSSTQATKCAGCGEHKHTPLRIDAMGGYVCLTCIDQKLGSLLGEFGYPAQTPPQFTGDLPKGDIVFFDSRGDALDGYSAQRVREIVGMQTPPTRLDDEQLTDIYRAWEEGAGYDESWSWERAVEAAVRKQFLGRDE